MTSMELLETLGDVKEKFVYEALGDVLQEDTVIQISRSTGRRRMPLKRSLLIAAVVAMMLMLVGCAVILWRLWELKVGEYTYNDPYMESIGETRTVTKDLISMQGFMDSDNFRAAKEWNEYLESYDPDGSLIKNAKTDVYQEPMEYMAYTCYTQEMQDKLDEICARYGLEVLGPVYMEEYAIDVVKAVGIESIFAETANVPTVIDEGYYYRDGTFHLSGTTTLNYEASPWIYPVRYQYRCVMKSAFDTVFLSVDDIDGFEEWNYTLQDGTKVLLALSPEKALIIADKEQYFVTVNILETRVGDVLYGEQQMGREGLEAFAETFTFDYVPARPDPAALIAPEWFTEAEPSSNPSMKEAASSEEAALAAYASFLSGDRELLESTQLEQWWIPDFQDKDIEYEYTYLDLDGDSVVELLIQMINDLSGYNAVFHFADGKLLCWNSDTTEVNCRDYPLSDGKMVRQYDYNGTRSYTIFRYRNNGETEEFMHLFAREELIPEDSTEPCPYYTIDGREVDKAVFEEKLAEVVTDRILEREDWTAL